MRRLLTGYVIGFNRRHGRSGQLFQNRPARNAAQSESGGYKSIVCQEETYLRELGMSHTVLTKKLEMSSAGVGFSVERGEAITKKGNYSLDACAEFLKSIPLYAQATEL